MKMVFMADGEAGKTLLSGREVFCFAVIEILGCGEVEGRRNRVALRKG